MTKNAEMDAGRKENIGDIGYGFLTISPSRDSMLSPVRNLIWDNVRHILLVPMDIAITTMSSKGQVVIPASMRADLPEGEKLLIIREGGRIVLKPLADLEPSLRDDIVFAEKTEAALQEYRKGSFRKMKSDDFIDEMKSW